jgi:uncharacterized protein (DUF39 family)
MQKTIEEINEKIKAGKAVVCTAEEIIGIAKKKGRKAAARDIDVVTTGTFGPMCSSGVFINTGHTRPRMKITKAFVNNVEAFCGIAAVDLYVGATQLSENDPANSDHPGAFRYGGGHVIEDLVAGKEIKFRAYGYGTDCYPRRELTSTFTLHQINDAFLFNPRNSYQNYNVAVNLGKKRIYTYLGMLKPGLGNANYSSAGQLSPLLNDPLYRTIGIGTRIFLGGGIGYVAWPGTQHDPSVARTGIGVPKGGSGTIAVIGDLKQMKPQWLRGTSIMGYGVSLTVGIGIPIPIIDDEMLVCTTVSDRNIVAPVVDYSYEYPNLTGKIVAETDYASLKSGRIKIGRRSVPTYPISSYPKAREIAQTLKSWIVNKRFFLTTPVQLLPGKESGVSFKAFGGRYR